MHFRSGESEYVGEQLTQDFWSIQRSHDFGHYLQYPMSLYSRNL